MRKFSILSSVLITAIIVALLSVSLYAKEKTQGKEVLLKSADALFAEGKRDEAVKEYLKVLQADPKCANAYDRLAYLSMSLGRDREAFEYARKAVSFDDTLSVSFNILGMMEEGRGSIDEAETYYLKAVRNNPSYAKALNNLGNIYVKRKEYRRAEETYQKAIVQEPKLAMAHNNLAYIYEIQGKLKSAEEEYQKALAADSSSQIARNNLTRLKDKMAEKEAGAEERKVAESICSVQLPQGFRLVKGVVPKDGGKLALYEYNYFQKVLLRELPKENTMTEELFSQMILKYKDELIKLLEQLMEAKAMKINGQGYVEVDGRKVLYISTEFQHGGVPVDGVFAVVTASKKKLSTLIMAIAPKGLYERNVTERFLKKAHFDR
ncbi:MAG: tetratricopeptide repeat protein [Vulcanimicrobiota bacterium]